MVLYFMKLALGFDQNQSEMCRYWEHIIYILKVSMAFELHQFSQNIQLLSSTKCRYSVGSVYTFLRDARTI
jgi:hypothetical protein